MTEKNINTIKTREDFEFVAIHYNAVSITKEQKNKIKEWAKTINNDISKLYFDFYNKYIRFTDDNSNLEIRTDSHSYCMPNNKDKYTIIELEDFLCETPEQKAEEKMNEINKRLDALTPAIINDASETWQKFTDAWNALYYKAEKIKSKKSLELLTTKIKEL